MLTHLELANFTEQYGVIANDMLCDQPAVENGEAARQHRRPCSKRREFDTHPFVG